MTYQPKRSEDLSPEQTSHVVRLCLATQLDYLEEEDLGRVVVTNKWWCHAVEESTWYKFCRRKYNVLRSIRWLREHVVVRND